jgi:hypothetical protein
MVTDSTGAGINLTAGSTTSYSINYGIKNTWKTDDCFIIIFVQSTSTKKVYGVERIKVN